MPVVLYGCEAWSLTLREERKLRVFENMVLRRIFGPRRDEVTGEWRRLHNVELCVGVDGWIILGWISRRWDMGIWTGLGWPRIGTGGGCL